MGNSADSLSIVEPNSFLDIFHNEKARLMRKGSQVFIGIGLTIFFYFCIPSLLYPFYCLLPFYNAPLLVVVGSVIVGNLTTIILHLITNNIYASKYPYFEQYRTMQEPWPWEVDEIAYKQHYRKMMTNTIKGSLFIFPLLSSLTIYFNLIEYIADPELYPSSYEIFMSIMYMAVIFDTLYYWAHRLFHTSWLYKKFHKLHHEYKVTVSIAAQYNHPVDVIITSVIPSLIARILLGRMHVITVYMSTFFNISFGHFNHCGYSVPWYPWGAFPFGIDSEYHDFHHSANIGNYSTFSTYWDTVCGTNKHHWISLKKKEEKSC